MLRKAVETQTVLEEVFNAISHGICALLGVVAIVVMVMYSANSAIRIVSASVYGGTLTMMYTASTIYHSIQKPNLKRVFKVIDHMSIYLLIAGTYTPLTLITMHGPWGWSLFGVAWGIALFGIVFKLFFTGRFEALSVGLYIGMGWLVLIGVKPLVAHMATAGLIWLAAGGLAYMLGVVFYLLDGKYHFSHFLWHLFVVMGSVFQFIAVFYYVIK